MSQNDLALAAPILLPAFAAILLILVDLFADEGDAGGSLLLAVFGALTPLVYSAYYLLQGRTGFAFEGTLLVDRMALTIAVVVHFAALLAILMSRQYLARRPDIEPAEYYAFLLTSAAGMTLLAAANDMVNLFLGIELLSIPLYLLAAMRRRQARSIEAGFKYLLLGAFASAFLVFGIGLLLAASGATRLTAMPAEIHRLATAGPLAAFGAAMFLIGLLFKVAAAPFHMWTPDVYEGAPTPVTAFMATATKAATFAALIRFAPVLAASMGAERGALLISTFAVLSMLVGNLGALRQDNLKRLLAYSSIAHAGYMLVGVAAIVAQDGTSHAATGAAALLYYLAVYSAMNLGAFAIAVVLDRGLGKEGVSELAGLGRERPLLAAAMAVLALALAGIPPTAGFFGKLYVFSAAVEAGLLPLAVAGVLFSVVGLYYYLRLLLVMYAQERPESEPRRLGSDAFIAVTSLVAVALVLLLGIAPDRFVALVQQSVGALTQSLGGG